MSKSRQEMIEERAAKPHESIDVSDEMLEAGLAALNAQLIRLGTVDTVDGIEVTLASVYRVMRALEPNKI